MRERERDIERNKQRKKQKWLHQETLCSQVPHPHAMFVDVDNA